MIPNTNKVSNPFNTNTIDPLRKMRRQLRNQKKITSLPFGTVSSKSPFSSPFKKTQFTENINNLVILALEQQLGPSSSPIAPIGSHHYPILKDKKSISTIHHVKGDSFLASRKVIHNQSLIAQRGKNKQDELRIKASLKKPDEQSQQIKNSRDLSQRSRLSNFKSNLGAHTLV